MSLFGRQRRAFQGMTAEEYIRYDRSLRVGPGSAMVTNDTALRHSAVWACLRLRANLVSTMPVDVFRDVNNVPIEVPKPPVLVNPGGERVDAQEWLYSSQIDLDRAGNGVGLITETAGTGLPARIDLQPIGECAVVPTEKSARAPDGWMWRICGKKYFPDEVWHEKQYTVSGLPVGLSPVAYAAWTIGEYLSIQDFALDWFGNGGVPAQHLKNTKQTLDSKKAQEIKDRYSASVKSGGLFVSGADWELNLLQSEAAGQSFLDAKQYGIGDVARFFDVPGDLIDAAVQSGNITYANITQRNLQFLIMHLGPAIIRRENALSRLLPRPRYVKLNTDALLRMDPKSRADMFKVEIDSRTIAPSEVRQIEDRLPFTDEQLAEFDRLFGPAKSAPTPASAPVAPSKG
jgi:HK97 family phage portal protein